MDRDENRTDLDVLLSKHRLTFNWLNPGQKWYLVGQLKGSNTLVRSELVPAENIEIAKAAAVDFIRKMYP